MKKNAGFTLVEMVVVLTIMAIMLGASVWGVTGWIAHYEYISCEEKARTVYMAAQSALSAAEGRGTLDECMDSIAKQGVIMNETVRTSAGILADAAKDTDNEGEKHQYVYLSVCRGQYDNTAADADKDDTHGSRELYELLKTYISDTEQLNGSIVVEFDLTAKKVYGVFYSSWATRLTYSEAVTENEVRGVFRITAENRKPENREDYSVGYYGVDQVNVVKLEQQTPLEIELCKLVNEETLHLDLRSSSGNKDIDTRFTVELYEGIPGASGATAQKPLCSFQVSRRQENGTEVAENGSVVLTQVMDADGKPLKDTNGELISYPFVLSFQPESEEGKGDFCLSLTLDALCTGKSMALLDEPRSRTEDGEKFTDRRGLSITRLLGVTPKNIFANVSVEGASDGIVNYAAGSPQPSNWENDLFCRVDPDSNDPYTNSHACATDSNASNAYVYELSTLRHLSNVRYVEEYQTAPDQTYFSYRMKEECADCLWNWDWNNGTIYRYNVEAKSYESLDIAAENARTDNKEKVGFPMLPKLNPGSVLDGNGVQISNLLFNNESGVVYAHKSDGTVESLQNQAKTLGLFGTNYGTIRRVIFSHSVEQLLSAEKYGEYNDADHSVANDSVEAAGLVCGRNAGHLGELYFDKDCAVQAVVSVGLSDEREAEAGAVVSQVDYTDLTSEQKKYENPKYASGVGMVAGTVDLQLSAVLDEKYKVGRVTGGLDRIYTAGRVQGEFLSGSTYQSTPEVEDEENRSKIYDDEKDASGRSNADRYAYGVGGVFGYVYGVYNQENDQPGIGISRESVKSGATGYMTMYRHEKDAEGVYRKNKSLQWMEANDDRSIVNKASVSGDSFTGGIVGNVFVSGLTGNKQDTKDSDGDFKVPDNAVPQLVNCHNYGDTNGKDFVGGVVGVNGKGGYILDCSSYGSCGASAGVSAGIASENYGYIKDCLLDRAPADAEHDDQPYVPTVDGNMLFAGAIASVNHEGCVIKDCRSAISDVEGVGEKITISGKEMNTFGFLVGKNKGVVDGGRAGTYLGYNSPKTKLVIGGAVGTNYSVLKNVTVSFDLQDKGQADCIGGLVGENYDKVKNCRFSGKITKNRNCASSLAVGGVVGRNGDGEHPATVEYCYIAGAQIVVKGSCGFEEPNSEERKLAMSSAVGGICGINRKFATLQNCYATCLSEENGEMERQSELQVKYGMAGGIVAANLGTVESCGYTDRVIYEDAEQLLKIQNLDVKDMQFAEEVQTCLKANSGSGNPYDLFMDDGKANPAEKPIGELRESVRNLCGTLSVKQDEELWANALPKEAHPAEEGDLVDRPAYDDSQNKYLITLKRNGRGYLGGIAGYNGQGATLTKCATGKWVVEAYLPDPKYRSVLADGGVIGDNAAQKVAYNLNLAYVRLELASIPLDEINGSGQNNIRDIDRGFFYVGGVIGNQRNVTKSGWTVEKCVNAGTVLNYFGNNAGGIISRVTENGGTVQSCYNYGTLMTGFTDATKANYGTAGGIVSHYSELRPDQVNNVLDCENHGIVGLAMEGLDYHTNLRKSKVGGMMANDTGGIVGEISAPDSTNLYTVNIRNCVNGKNARIYSNSTDAGILGKIGCYAKNGNEKTETVNNLFVNIDTCRNYSSQIWNCQGISSNVLLSRNSAGILSGRQVYADNADKLGYTTVQNCLSVRMAGFDGNGNMNRNQKSTEKVSEDGKTEETDNNRNGKIASEKTTNKLRKVLETYKYCANNYFVDERSFQYCDSRGRIKKNGFDANAKNSDIPGGDRTKVNALVATEKPDESTKTVLKPVVYSVTGLNAVREAAYANYMDDLSLSLDAKRLVSVAYLTGNAGNESYGYGMAFIPYAYDITEIDANNAYLSDDKTKLHLIVEDGEVVCDMLLMDMQDKSHPATYSTTSLDYFSFVQTSPTTSRLPSADEFDEDFEKLDTVYVQYVEDLKEKQKANPDRVKHVNVSKNSTAGNYLVTWELEPGNAGEQPSATEFDVEISYYKVAGDAFTPNDPGSSSIWHKPEQKKAYGTTTTFTPPSDTAMEAGYKYYAVVKVKDARGGNTFYSDISDEEDCKSYILLDPKLPTPEFEFVSFEGQWQLHLKNAKAFESFVDMNIGAFEMGVYAVDKNSRAIETTRIKMTSSELSFPDKQEQILINAKPIPDGKTVYDTMNLELFAYAKAVGSGSDKPFLDADLESMMVYIPTNPVPEVVCTQTEVTDHLSDRKNKPEYSATLNYQSFDGETEMPTAQVFRIELYGKRTVKDAENNKTEIHETVASREVAVDAGDTLDFEIGYYDVPEDVLGRKYDENRKLIESGTPGTPAYTGLGVYEEFGIACWCAGSGQGEVRYYVELPFDDLSDEMKGKVENQLRKTGYITDLARGEYDFMLTEPLPVPELEVVCLERKASDNKPGWYARLLNPEDFEGTQAKIQLRAENNTSDRTQEIDLSDSTLTEGILPYAVRIDQSGWNSSRGKLTYWAYQEGYVTSVQHYSPSKGEVVLQRDLGNGLYVNLQMTVKDSTDDEGKTVPGFTLNREEKKLTFHGAVKYHSHNEIPQYYRYELYAYDENEQPVTLYLSADQKMENAPGTDMANLHGEDDVDVTLNGDYLLNYHNFHAAVWYSRSDLSKTESASIQEINGETHQYSFAQYFEMEEDEAIAAATALDVYDTTAPEHPFFTKEAREKGFLVYYDRESNTKKYYFAAPLKDPNYAAQTSSYKNYVLYSEPEQTVAAVTLGDSVEVVGKWAKKVQWKSYPNFYGQNAKAQVHYSVYKWDGDTEPTVDELRAKEESDADEDKPKYQGDVFAADHYYAVQTDEEKNDYPIHEGDNYYALVSVRDRYVTGNTADSVAYRVVPLLQPLPKPEISMYNLGWQGDLVHLENYEEFAEYGEDVKIKVKLTNPEKTYEINVDAKTKEPFYIPIPYSAVINGTAGAANRHRNPKVTAWAELVDTDGTVLARNEENFEKSIYLPYGAEPIPKGMTITNSLQARIVNNQIELEKGQFKFTADDSYYDAPNTQGFSILLVGTLKQGFEQPDYNRYNNQVILYKTEDDYLKLQKGDVLKADSSGIKVNDTVITVEPMVIPSTIDLEKYDLKLYIRHSSLGNVDFINRQAVEMKEDEFNTVCENVKGSLKDAAGQLLNETDSMYLRGLMIDLTGDEPKYTFQRFLGETNRNTNKPETRGYAEIKIVP